MKNILFTIIILLLISAWVVLWFAFYNQFQPLQKWSENSREGVVWVVLCFSLFAPIIYMSIAENGNRN